MRTEVTVPMTEAPGPRATRKVTRPPALVRAVVELKTFVGRTARFSTTAVGVFYGDLIVRVGREPSAVRSSAQSDSGHEVVRLEEAVRHDREHEPDAEEDCESLGREPVFELVVADRPVEE